MAEIHILPFAIDLVQLKKATSVLDRAVEAGYDLGDRAHHIRKIGGNLDAIQQQLRRILTDIRETYLGGNPTKDSEELLLQLELFAINIERIAASAIVYAPERCTAEDTEMELC